MNDIEVKTNAVLSLRDDKLIVVKVRSLLAKALDALRENNLELGEEYAPTAISYLDQACSLLKQIEAKVKGSRL